MKSRYTATILLDEGGSANFYKLKESNDLGFKEFASKKEAIFAYNIQKKLAKFNLAPKTYGKIRRIVVKFENGSSSWYENTGWGFLTQIVKINKKLSHKKIQKLVDDIHTKTKLLFWDCHEYNIGTYRNKYLCIDTGKESFQQDCNAWGNSFPGPECKECKKYSCSCGWLF